MFGELKDWTVSLVLTPTNEFTHNAYVALWGVAFAESSFFPIPPDIPFILMGVAQPSVSLFLALILTCGSVLGGGLGYAIGLYGGRPFVEYLVAHRWLGHLFTHEKFEMVESFYQRYDVWAVLIAAFTPIPYKVFTIGGGLCRIRFWHFMLVSLVGRSGRFFLVGLLLYFFGDQAQFLLKRFDIFLIAMTALGILGFVALRFIKPAKGKERT